MQTAGASEVGIGIGIGIAIAIANGFGGLRNADYQDEYDSESDTDSVPD